MKKADDFVKKSAKFHRKRQHCEGVIEKKGDRERESQVSEEHFTRKVRGFVSHGFNRMNDERERESRSNQFSQLELIFYVNKNVNCGSVRCDPLEK